MASKSHIARLQSDSINRIEAMVSKLADELGVGEMSTPSRAYQPAYKDALYLECLADWVESIHKPVKEALKSAKARHAADERIKELEAALEALKPSDPKTTDTKDKE